MKTLNRLRCVGVTTILIAAGMSRAAEPIGPVDDPHLLARPWWLSHSTPASDFTAFQGATTQPAIDRFARNSVPAAAPGNPPTTAPTTQPAPPKVDALIAQLGDDQFAKRQEAADALRKLGKNALPALQKAATSDDPQTRISAQGLIGEITGTTSKPKPVAAADELEQRFRLRPGQMRIQPLPAGGARVSRMQVNMVVNGQITRDTTVDENGRKVHIHEDADGIKMEVTENGKTTETKAKTAAELNANDPAAFKLYESFNGQALGGIRIEPGVRP